MGVVDSCWSSSGLVVVVDTVLLSVSSWMLLPARVPSAATGSRPRTNLWLDMNSGWVCRAMRSDTGSGIAAVTLTIINKNLNVVTWGGIRDTCRPKSYFFSRLGVMVLEPRNIRPTLLISHAKFFTSRAKHAATYSQLQCHGETKSITEE